MYLFARALRLESGHGRSGLEWGLAMTEKVRQITDLPVELWSTVYSEGFGTIHFTAWIPDLQTLEAAGDKLVVDDSYIDLVDRGAELTVGGADDTLGRLVHGEPSDAPITYVSGVNAICRSGNLAKGMLTAIGIADRATAITGANTLVMQGTTGPYGSVAWLTGYADAAAAQAAQEALADSDFVNYLDTDAKDIYLEDASITQTVMYRKMS
jgi:hypothetical protein